MEDKNYPQELYGLTQQQTAEVVTAIKTGYGCFYDTNKSKWDLCYEHAIRDLIIGSDHIFHLTMGADSDSSSFIIFIIESLTDEELILKGLEDMCRVVYKRVGATTVNEITTDETAPQYYNLNGITVDNPSKGIYIERTGNTAHKILNTNQ